MGTGIEQEIKERIKGRVFYNEPMARHTSFRIGGPADIWVEPEGENDLKGCVQLSRDKNIPLFIIGNGTNLLVKDDGIRGIVVNMSTHIGNTIEVWLERERIAQIPDFCLDTREAAGGANAYKSATKMGFIRLDVEIPYGQTLKVAVASGATANDLSGAYQYEEM